ncbi:unnamed protein product [Brassica rapa]|uniref:non-specific serine/threonine protein kinase n=1 Tax=Brassica campestris TaxID=3711 RepID=A0A3P5ZJK3_BRACM|nr:unnamed protein product [Brassica rapa]VDC73001.1 unnamed protein product [Brassica rapa]
METHLFLLFLSLLLFLSKPGSGFGSSGPIAASFGGTSAFFCAIDASGRQEVICWGKNYSSPSSPSSSSSSSTSQSYNIPSMAVLSGGDGFLCGVLSNTSQPFCFSSLGSSSSGTDLVPLSYRTTAYSQIAAGNRHVCAVRGAYYSDHDSGTVDCWEITRANDNSFTAKESSNFYDQNVSNLVFNKIVSGDGFSCGGVREGGVLCFGPKSSTLGLNTTTSDSFEVLSAGKSSLCAILNSSREVKCWGDEDSFANSPSDDSRFVALASGPNHYCGIREDTHEVACWGNANFSLIPKASGFKAIASSDSIVCGIREEDLVLDCWMVDGSSTLAYDPPLELCSPGVCRAGPCGDKEFAFNASILDEPDLTSLCVRKELSLCSPCGSDCSKGFFLSSSCTENSDRVCTSCSLCQNSSCSDICKVHNRDSSLDKHWNQLALIVGSSASALLIIIICCCVVPRFVTSPNKEDGFKSCIGKTDLETEPLEMIAPAPSVTPFAQVFRLSELKDATNGFKEFNELGRGSYGFVYKAVLSDGRQVAVKRANASTIIHTNAREFEAELEILCNIRHSNIVNLIGYSTEMGERLLVYEYMPHGTLHDHLHGGFSPLSWGLRVRIALQTAKGLEYLHVEAEPRIVHGDVKSSNVLLDSEWAARVADFGLMTSSNERSLDVKGDVYDFGVVLLEILTGRKRYDRDCDPPEIVEWAVPVIREGKAAAILDKYIALPRNVEPLLKLADVAELCVREDPSQRPTMSELVNLLDQFARDGLIL